MTWGSLRFWSVILLLGGAALLLTSRAGSENLPPRKPIAEFPVEIGEWKGRATQIQADILEALGKGEFATRLYWREPQEAGIDFFLAYFPSQRTGDTLHSPQNCLPGAGWAPLQNSRITLELAPGKTVFANRFIIGKGLDKQVVYYWYQAHGRTIASEYEAKVFLVVDAIRLNRTDGALVRIITQVGRDEAVEKADARAVSFAKAIFPTLPEYLPE